MVGAHEATRPPGGANRGAHRELLAYRAGSLERVLGSRSRSRGLEKNRLFADELNISTNRRGRFYPMSILEHVLPCVALGLWIAFLWWFESERRNQRVQAQKPSIDTTVQVLRHPRFDARTMETRLSLVLESRWPARTPAPQPERSFLRRRHVLSIDQIEGVVYQAVADAEAIGARKLLHLGQQPQGEVVGPADHDRGLVTRLARHLSTG